MEVADIEVGFEYGAGDGATEREIIRNVEMIMATPVGSSPLYRDFGVDNSMLDKPLDVAAAYTRSPSWRPWTSGSREQGGASDPDPGGIRETSSKGGDRACLTKP